MNVRKRLEHIAVALGAGRRLGKTTLIAKACKDLDGVLLGANQAHAKMLKHQHDVTTYSVQQNLQGIRGPFFIDHYATEYLLSSAAKKITDLEMELKRLTDENEKLTYDLMDANNRLQDGY